MFGALLSSPLVALERVVPGTGLWELSLAMSQSWPHQRWRQGRTFLARCPLHLELVIYLCLKLTPLYL